MNTIEWVVHSNGWLFSPRVGSEIDPSIYVTIFYSVPGDRSACYNIRWDTHFPPKFASAPAPFWHVVVEHCRCQLGQVFRGGHLRWLPLISAPRECVEQSWYSHLGKDKAALAPMSGPFGIELIVFGPPDQQNGNSKKSMNRRGFGLGGVLNITGIVITAARKNA